jgi:uncharacterized membrane protein
MNKQVFLTTLRNSLKGLANEDIDEILYDYEEHFRIGIEQGKSEEDIAETLGDVKSIARQYKADCLIKKAEEDASTANIIRAVVAAGLLGFFNLAVVLGPFMGLIGVLIGLFATAGSLVVAGIVMIACVALAPFFPDYISLAGLNPAVIIFASIGITCLGLLFVIGISYMTKYFYIGTVKYLKWNIEFVKG